MPRNAAMIVEKRDDAALEMQPFDLIRWVDCIRHSLSVVWPLQMHAAIFNQITPS
jgi:hypothetical protein